MILAEKESGEPVSPAERCSGLLPRRGAPRDAYGLRPHFSWHGLACGLRPHFSWRGLGPPPAPPLWPLAGDMGGGRPRVRRQCSCWSHSPPPISGHLRVKAPADRQAGPMAFSMVQFQQLLVVTKALAITIGHPKLPAKCRQGSASRVCSDQPATDGLARIAIRAPCTAVRTCATTLSRHVLGACVVCTRHARRAWRRQSCARPVSALVSGRCPTARRTRRGSEEAPRLSRACLRFSLHRMMEALARHALREPRGPCSGMRGVRALRSRPRCWCGEPSQPCNQ